MNILIISSSDPTKIAGYGALILKEGLENKGFNVKLITKYKPQNNLYSNIIYYYNKYCKFIITIYSKVRNVLINIITTNKNLRRYLKENKILLPFKNPFKFIKLAGFVPDAIIIFFMPSFINYLDIMLLHKIYKCPIFVSTTDMYPFTGLCHYSGSCNRFQEFCGNCPAIHSKFKYDISWITMQIKHFVAKRTSLIGLCWTDEYENLLHKSSIFKNKPIVKIPAFMYLEKEINRLDEEVYYNLRRKYSINKNDYVVMISSVSLNDQRKGISDIINAINIVIRDPLLYDKLVIVTTGNGYLPIKPNVKKTINFGLVNYNDLADIFKLSDIFISASYEDVGPGTIPYALICGVPVISYDTGFAPEIISDYENGFIVKKKNINELSEKIREHFYMSQDKKEEMSYCAYNSVKYMFDYSFADYLAKAIIDNVKNNK